MSLTVKAIDGAKPRDKAYKLTDGHGLYLFVTTAGGKSWRANYSLEGKQKTRTYGSYPEMPLVEARRAHGAAKEAKGGKAFDASLDPVKVRVKTFQQVAEQWLNDKKLAELSNSKHKIQVANTLERFVYPVIGARTLDSIQRTELVDIVRGIIGKDGRVETAHRVAGRITAVFNFAQDAGMLDVHPAQGLTRVLQARKIKKPMATILPSEASDLMKAIHSYPDEITRLGLILLAYTFVRTGELRGMAYDEFKEEGAVWVVPAERVKGKGNPLPHVVPMSTQAQAIVKKLKKMTGDGHLVLDSPARPGHMLSENTLLFALYRLGYKGKMTGHGFRSLASSVLNEFSDFDPDVIERQLAHSELDQVRAAYNRAQYLPQRRELMQWWADWLDRQYSPAMTTLAI